MYHVSQSCIDGKLNQGNKKTCIEATPQPSRK